MTSKADEKPDDRPGSKSNATGRLSHAEARQQRLEEQLRANLKKRKDQVRQRAAATKTESEDGN